MLQIANKQKKPDYFISNFDSECLRLKYSERMEYQKGRGRDWTLGIWTLGLVLGFS